jgi:hypothetical protein
MGRARAFIPCLPCPLGLIKIKSVPVPPSGANRRCWSSSPAVRLQMGHRIWLFHSRVTPVDELLRGVRCLPFNPFTTSRDQVGNSGEEGRRGHCNIAESSGCQERIVALAVFRAEMRNRDCRFNRTDLGRTADAESLWLMLKSRYGGSAGGRLGVCEVGPTG